MKISVYEKKIQCNNCDERINIHMPSSFADYHILRCNKCNDENFLSYYDKKNGMDFFLKWFEYKHPVGINDLIEKNAAIEMVVKECACGGTYLFVGWFTPVICKCGQIIKILNKNKTIIERWEEDDIVQIEPKILKWKIK